MCGKIYSFSKKSRLLTAQEYFFVFQKYKRIENIYFSILGRLNRLYYPRLGIIVSKKNIRKSYNRNRIKRLIRENFRLNQYNIIYMDFIIIVKKETYSLNNFAIQTFLNKLWIFFK